MRGRLRRGLLISRDNVHCLAGTRKVQLLARFALNRRRTALQRVVLLRDTPYPGIDVPVCLARQAWRARFLPSTACAFEPPTRRWSEVFKIQQEVRQCLRAELAERRDVQLATEHGGVELHGGAGVALECQVWVETHAHGILRKDWQRNPNPFLLAARYEVSVEAARYRARSLTI